MNVIPDWIYCVKLSRFSGPIFRLINQLWGVCLGTNTLLFSSLGGFVKKYVDLRVSLLTSKDQWLFYLKVRLSIFRLLVLHCCYVCVINLE